MDMFYIIKEQKWVTLSVLIFIMFIDRIFKPMVNTAMIMKSIHGENLLNPILAQGYADNVNMLTYIETLMCKMIESAELVLGQSGLSVKIFYERWGK